MAAIERTGGDGTGVTRKWAEARSKILRQASLNTESSRSRLVDRPAIGLRMPYACLAGGTASIGLQAGAHCPVEGVRRPLG